MTTDRDRAIRDRAYHLWVESGHRHGEADDHWRQAERELSADTPPPSAKPARAKTSATSAAPAAAKRSPKPSGATEAPGPPKGRPRASAPSPKA